MVFPLTINTDQVWQITHMILHPDLMASPNVTLTLLSLLMDSSIHWPVAELFTIVNQLLRFLFNRITCLQEVKVKYVSQFSMIFQWEVILLGDENICANKFQPKVPSGHVFVSSLKGCGWEKHPLNQSWSIGFFFFFFLFFFFFFFVCSSVSCVVDWAHRQPANHLISHCALA